MVELRINALGFTQLLHPQSRVVKPEQQVPCFGYNKDDFPNPWSINPEPFITPAKSAGHGKGDNFQESGET